MKLSDRIFHHTSHNRIYISALVSSNFISISISFFVMIFLSKNWWNFLCFWNGLKATHKREQQRKKNHWKKKDCSTFSVCCFVSLLSQFYFFFLWHFVLLLHTTCICFSSSLFWTYSVTGLTVCSGDIQCIHFQQNSLSSTSIFTFVQKGKIIQCVLCVSSCYVFFSAVALSITRNDRNSSIQY